MKQKDINLLFDLVKNLSKKQSELAYLLISKIVSDYNLLNIAYDKAFVKKFGSETEKIRMILELSGYESPIDIEMTNAGFLTFLHNNKHDLKIIPSREQIRKAQYDYMMFVAEFEREPMDMNEYRTYIINQNEQQSSINTTQGNVQ